MANWRDLLILINLTAAAITDEQGFYLPQTETKREVFANKKSVGYSEFYKSAQSGRVAEVKFTIRTAEYEGEKYAEHGGKRYKVLRTYETANGEFTELTLTDLSETDLSPEGEGGADDGRV